MMWLECTSDMGATVLALLGVLEVSVLLDFAGGPVTLSSCNLRLREEAEEEDEEEVAEEEVDEEVASSGTSSSSSEDNSIIDGGAGFGAATTCTSGSCARDRPIEDKKSSSSPMPRPKGSLLDILRGVTFCTLLAVF